MPAKLSTICYVVECAERLTRNFTVKDVTAVTRLSEQDPTKVSYLRVKAFVPLDEEVEHNIDEFGKDDVIYLKGKFVGCDDWYSVNATSIKLMDISYDLVPVIGLDVVLTGITTQTVRNVDGNSILEFFIEERLGEREPRDFWVEVRHNSNNSYLANKTNPINQNGRSTTAVLVGTISYLRPVTDAITGEISSPGKHLLKLEDISLMSSQQRASRTTSQPMNFPWMTSGSNNSSRGRGRTPRGATPRTPRRGRGGRNTLAQMESSSTSQNLSLAEVLQTVPNPIPPSTIPDEQPPQDEQIMTD